MKTKKTYTITETGKAEVLSNTCPICGDAGDGNPDSWDFVSNKWSKAPLLCGHGYVFTENMNTTDDAANDDWQDSVLIKPEYIHELEALGYTEAQQEKEMWQQIIDTRICPNCGRIMESYSGMPTNGVPSSVFRGSCLCCGTEVKITEIFEDGDKATEIFGEIVIL